MFLLKLIKSIPEVPSCRVTPVPVCLSGIAPVECCKPGDYHTISQFTLQSHYITLSPFRSK